MSFSCFEPSTVSADNFSLSLSLSLPPAHKMRYTELIIRFATLTNAIKSVIPSIKKQKREAQLQFWKPR